MNTERQPIRLRKLEQVQDLTLDEIYQVLPVLARLTSRYRRRVDHLVSRYGQVTEGEIEREILSQEVANVLLEWAQQVRRLGGEPRELWSVHFFHNEGVYHWDP